MKELEAIINEIGEKSVLKFSFISDHIITFESVIPLYSSYADDSDEGNLDFNDYKIEVFAPEDYSSLQIFCYMPLINIIDDFKVYDISIKNNYKPIESEEYTPFISIYHKKYNEI